MSLANFVVTKQSSIEAEDGPAFSNLLELQNLLQTYRNKWLGSRSRTTLELLNNALRFVTSMLKVITERDAAKRFTLLLVRLKEVKMVDILRSIRCRKGSSDNEKKEASIDRQKARDSIISFIAHIQACVQDDQLLGRFQNLQINADTIEAQLEQQRKIIEDLNLDEDLIDVSVVAEANPLVQ